MFFTSIAERREDEEAPHIKMDKNVLFVRFERLGRDPKWLLPEPICNFEPNNSFFLSSSSLLEREMEGGGGGRVMEVVLLFCGLESHSPIFKFFKIKNPFFYMFFNFFPSFDFCEAQDQMVCFFFFLRENNVFVCMMMTCYYPI